MAFTYDPRQPTPRDKLRFIVGDTVQGLGPFPDGRNFADEELDALLAEHGEPLAAAVAAFEHLAAVWSRYVNTKAGGVSEALGDVVGHYLRMAEVARRRLAVDGVGGEYGAQFAGSLYAHRIVDEEEQPHIEAEGDYA